MELIRPVGLLLGVAIVHGAGCSTSGNPNCAAACAALEGCGFLPSILGAGSDKPSSDPESDCVARCRFSTDLVDQTQIVQCAGEACPQMAACLHSDYPNSPVTGTSRVELVGDFDGGDGGLQSECAADAGAGVAFVRGFVDVWGARSYSPDQPCAMPLQVYFQDVPAGPAVTMGFQITQAAACSEYALVRQVNAGIDPLAVHLNLAGPSSSCVPDAPAEAGATGTGDAGPTDGGMEGATP